MRETYRNPRNQRLPKENDPPPGRYQETEVYLLEQIAEWLKYIFWGVIACGLMAIPVLFLAIKVLVAR